MTRFKLQSFCLLFIAALMLSIPGPVLLSAPQDAPAQAPARVRVGANLAARNLVSKVAAEYPAAARAARTTGEVIMEVVIGRDGRVIDASIVSGPDVFWQSSMDAVRQWVYRPFLLNGEEIEAVTSVSITYSFQ